ncbi:MULTISPECIES: hypothetical protein [unclassified Marinovum]
MNKFAFAAVAALSLSAAAPVLAQQADTAADPFLSTQGEGTALVILGAAAGGVLIVAATSGDSSSSTGTN